jgi:Pgp3 C-terminal domain
MVEYQVMSPHAQWIGSDGKPTQAFFKCILGIFEILGTNSPGTLIADHSVSNVKLAQAPAHTIKGNPGAALADVADATLSANLAFAGSVLGLSKTIGQIVNVETGAVATGATIIPNDDTIPQNTEGDQYMSLAITPKSAASTLLIDVIAVLSSNAANNLTLALFQDAIASALAAVQTFATTATGMAAIPLRHKMIAGTTSPITFKLRAGGGIAGTTTFNGQATVRRFGGVMASSMTITEVLP